MDRTGNPCKDVPTGTQVIPNLSISRMGLISQGYESVLTLAAVPGLVPDHVRHRHLPLSPDDLDADRIREGAAWVVKHYQSYRHVLIRSEGGKQRPGLVAAVALVHLGATAEDALWSLRYPLDETRRAFLIQEAAAIDDAVRSRQTHQSSHA